MPLPDSTNRIFAEEVSGLRRDVDTLQRAFRSAQLGQSTIDDGAIGVTSNGVTRGQIGIAADGSFAVIASNAPPPPAPSTPTVTPIATGAMVRWDGNFNGASRPLDFSFVEIWHNTSNNFATATLDGNMTDPGDWPVAPLASGGVHYFWLTAVNTSQKRSGPSGVASATPEMVVAQAVLDGIVTELGIANQAISQNKIKLGAVGQAQLGNQAVGLSQLADGSVNAAKLLPNAVTQPAIATDAVTANAIAANSIIAGKIATDAVTANSILANSVGTSELVANAVTSDKIVSNAITADKILALAITADKVAANAINAGHIQAGSITAAKLATTLLLSTTIIAGTSTTGARVVLSSAGIEAYRSNGMKTLDFDTATGNITIAGQYRSADGGSRIEINPGGGAADTMRLYQNTVFAEVLADPGPGGTAAILIQGSGSAKGRLGAYNGEAFTSHVTSGGTSSSAVSALSSAMNIWGPGVSVDARGSSSSAVTFTRQGSGGSRLLYRCTGNEPQLYSPNWDIQLTFTNTGTLYVGDNAGNPEDIVAKNVLASSSRRVKKHERLPKFGKSLGSATGVANKLAKDVIKQVSAKQWNYDNERAPEDQGTPVARKGKYKKTRYDDKMQLVYGLDAQPIEDEIEFEIPLRPISNPHVGPIAEELMLVAPELVSENSNVPGGLVIRYNDLVGTIWQGLKEALEDLQSLQLEVDNLKKKVK